MTDTAPSLSQAFWSATRGTAPLPLANEPKQSGGCGCSEPAAEDKKEEETKAPAKAASSCCGPKPAADTAASA